ncbi:Sip1-related alpha-galactosidase [Nibricoccus sp. IMCC34717]|uniref:Sip1-related alpha-galactosidase n=1 Tax=Nibricoccus sp. IMCC34717 TaxID=3034021 RepID=UPI00384AF19C
MSQPTLRFTPFASGSLARLPADCVSENWIPLPDPVSGQLLGLRRANPFWFVPCRYANAANVSSEHEVSFLLSSDSGRWILRIALPGPHHRSRLESRDGVLGIHWTIDAGADAADAPLVYECSGKVAHQLIENAVAELREVMPFHRTRAEKPSPAFIEGLGWCTWDAFYSDVTATGIAAGLRSFTEEGLRLHFVILDDGWQDTRDCLLKTTGTNAKFPGGLAEVSRLVRQAGVSHFGVWHTLNGYWHGFDPEGALAKRHRVTAVPQTTKAFDGWPEVHDPRTRFTLHPEDAPVFYQEFYQRLAAAGVDFTKVDGQATTPFFAEGKFPVADTFSRYQAAFQGASAVHMRAGGIHCMANSPDILWRHAIGTVWRNSDDFYPAKPFRAQAEHVCFNAGNALFTRAFVIPDWDMFQSTHATAIMHAACRALSGGPVYVSDKPGQHNLTLLRRLVREDGTILRFPTPGRPVETTLLQDPLRDPVPLMLFNESGGVGQIALINCLCDPEPRELTFKWRVSDLMPHLSARARVVLQDPISGETQVVSARESIRETLAAEGGTRVWTVSPVLGPGIAPLGQPGLYAAAAAVESTELLDEQTVAVHHHRGGFVEVWCASKPHSVTLKGQTLRSRYATASHLLRLAVPEGEPAPVVISL